MSRNAICDPTGFTLAVLASVLSFQAFPQNTSLSSGGLQDKPIRIVVTTVAGGGIDLITRPITDKLSQRTGRPVLVDNRSGANGVIGTSIVAEAAADGTTLLSTGNSFVINGVLKSIPYDIRQAFVPVAQMSNQDFMVFSHPSLPVSTFKEMLDYARTNPGKLNFGSSGTGSVGHLGMEIIKAKTGVEIVHIPYKGNAQASLDLAAGRIQLFFSNIAGVQMVRAGKAKVIGVMTPKRMPAYPDIPSVAESGIPGFELSNTYSIYALSKTQPQIVSTLNREIIQILKSPEIKERYAVDSSEVALPYTPEELRKRFFSEFDKWESIVRIANIKTESL